MGRVSGETAWGIDEEYQRLSDLKDKEDNCGKAGMVGTGYESAHLRGSTPPGFSS